MAKDLYEVLGVASTASQAEIKKAYKKLARKFHPDVNPGDAEAEARFKEIGAAYAVLENEDKRKLYDEFGDDAEKFGYDPEKAKAYRAYASGGGGGFSGDFSSGFPGGGFSGGGAGFDFGDILSDLFGGRGGGGGFAPDHAPRRGADVDASMTVDFLDAVRGSKQTIELDKPTACSACQGSGHKGAPGPCAGCGGTGRANVARGPVQVQATCRACGGSGRSPGPACGTCGGNGQVRRRTKLTVDVPVGVESGQKIRLAGQGAPGRNGGPSGHLFITIHVRPHALFERKKQDLEYALPITVGEAMRGAQLDVPTLDGRVKLKIPAGAQSGQRLRLRGKGVPAARGGEAGDLYVRLSVVAPKAEDEEAKALADRIDALYEGDVRAELERKL